MNNESNRFTSTPEQLRALASRSVQVDDGYRYSVPAADLVEYNNALRLAADRIEAVRAWAYERNRSFGDVVELNAILEMRDVARDYVATQSAFANAQWKRGDA